MKTPGEVIENVISLDKSVLEKTRNCNQNGHCEYTSSNSSEVSSCSEENVDLSTQLFPSKCGGRDCGRCLSTNTQKQGIDIEKSSPVPTNDNDTFGCVPIVASTPPHEANESE